MWINLAKEDITRVHDALMAAGLEHLAKAMLDLAKDQNEDEVEAYRKAARENYHKDGELEFDAGCTVSISEDGAYVMGWRWIPAEDVEF